MSGITLGQIGIAITFLVGLISGISYLQTHLKIWISQALKDQLDSINGRINDLSSQIDEVDMESTKNYLVTFLSALEKDQTIDDLEVERFWEQYQHYRKKGGNSYIERKVELLKSEGRI